MKDKEIYEKYEQDRKHNQAEASIRRALRLAHVEDKYEIVSQDKYASIETLRQTWWIIPVFIFSCLAILLFSIFIR